MLTDRREYFRVHLLKVCAGGLQTVVQEIGLINTKYVSSQNRFCIHFDKVFHTFNCRRPFFQSSTHASNLIITGNVGKSMKVFKI